MNTPKDKLLEELALAKKILIAGGLHDYGYKNPQASVAAARAHARAFIENKDTALADPVIDRKAILFDLAKFIHEEEEAHWEKHDDEDPPTWLAELGAAISEIEKNGWEGECSSSEP